MQLPRESRLGDEQASEQLISLVYDEVHRLAGQSLCTKRVGHTLPPNARE